MKVNDLLLLTQESCPMLQKQVIPCPNCGQNAIRTQKSDSDSGGHCRSGRVTSIECPTCDYLMVSCSLTGEVVEAYAPSFEMSHWKMRPNLEKVPPLV